MKLGLHLDSYTWPGGQREIGTKLRRIAIDAEAAGFARLSVTDHLWQISTNGVEDEPMLEAYTTLGHLSGATERIELLALVTAATYRPPGLLAKMVTTLDVLAGGRVWLGIGAGWNEEEATGLGVGFARTGERFERLEEVIRICLQMWSSDNSPYIGAHYALSSTLNSPQPVSNPRPRIMIGGAGEQRTLRLVAKYADACNVFGGADAARKLAVLRTHCDRVGRPYQDIEKTAILPMASVNPGERTALLDQLRKLHEMGFDTVQGPLRDVDRPDSLDWFAADVIPEISRW